MLLLMRLNNSPLEFKVEDIDRIVPRSSSLIIIYLKNGDYYSGYFITTK